MGTLGYKKAGEEKASQVKSRLEVKTRPAGKPKGDAEAMDWLGWAVWDRVQGN